VLVHEQLANARSGIGERAKGEQRLGEGQCRLQRAAGVWGSRT
jgi:hypothetical protein